VFCFRIARMFGTVLYIDMEYLDDSRSIGNEAWIDIRNIMDLR